MIKIDEGIEILDRVYGEVETFLDHQTDFQLLIAVILSAQTTDILVNRITPILFKEYPDAVSMANARLVDVEKIVQPVNYYKNKSKFIIQTADMIVNQFGGAVPNTLEELILLPGVGRKVANVLMAEAYGNATGFVVDTHVKRVTYRLGWTIEKTPEKVELDMMARVPKKKWANLPKQLILIGREYCYANKAPNCKECPLREVCGKRTLKK